MAVLIQTSQNVPIEYELASIGERILANVLDILLYIGWWLIWAFMLSNLGIESTFSVMVFLVLPISCYPLITEYYLKGQTLGKKALNIKVIRLDGAQPTLGNYLLRWLFSLIDVGVFYGTSVVAVITIAVGNKGQRLGDMAAGTTVIKTLKRVTLDQVAYETTTTDYELSFPQVTQLSDEDIATVRQVLRKQNAELISLTAAKIGDLLGCAPKPSEEAFLQTIVRDYTYLVAKEVEES